MSDEQKNLVVAPAVLYDDCVKTADDGTKKSGSKKRFRKVKLPKESAVVQIVKKPRLYMNHSYRDFSRVLPGACDAFPEDISKMSFPQKIHHILSQAEYAKCISWMPHGRAFRVHSPILFEKQVALKYLGHTRYSSFLRQLSNHRFKHITTGTDRNAHYHECLLRDLPHLCKYIPPPMKNASRLIPDPANEPNFYEIAKIHPLPDDEVAGGKATEAKQVEGSEGTNPKEKTFRKRSNKDDHPGAAKDTSSVSRNKKITSDSATNAKQLSPHQVNDVCAQTDAHDSINTIKNQVPGSANDRSKNKVTGASLVQTQPQAPANSIFTVPKSESHKPTTSNSIAHQSQLPNSVRANTKQKGRKDKGSPERSGATMPFPDHIMFAVEHANTTVNGQDLTSTLASSIDEKQMQTNGSSAQNQSTAILMPCPTQQHQNNSGATAPVSSSFNAQYQLIPVVANVPPTANAVPQNQNPITSILPPGGAATPHHLQTMRSANAVSLPQSVLHTALNDGLTDISTATYGYKVQDVLSSRSSNSQYIPTSTHPANNLLSTNTRGQLISTVSLASSIASAAPNAAVKPDQSLCVGPVPHFPTDTGRQTVGASVTETNFPATLSQHPALQPFVPSFVTANTSSRHQLPSATNMVTSSSAAQNNRIITVDSHAVLAALNSVLLHHQHYTC